MTRPPTDESVACHLMRCPACETDLWDLDGLDPATLTRLALIFRDHLREHGWSPARMRQWTQAAIARHNEVQHGEW